jgi:type IV secretion system protein VirB9
MKPSTNSGLLLGLLIGCVLHLTASHTNAATLPTLSTADRRIGFVDYQAFDVVVIPTALGVITRIILGEDEKITRHPDSGFPAACDEPLNEWCIRADIGQNQITVKPRKGATQLNLEVSTDKRDYSFALHAMPGAEKSKSVLYRVVFRYPMPTPPAAHVRLPSPASDASAIPADDQKSDSGGALITSTNTATATNSKRQELAKPSVRNVAYSVKAQGNASSILPSIIFDDGRFTYLKFPKASEVPAVFAVDANGQEVRVAFHAERLLADPHAPNASVESDYLVMRRVARAFTLRLGDLVAEVINDKFDAEGIETHNGTTTPTLKREAKP